MKGDAGPVDADALAAFGLPAVKRTVQAIDVWPENEKTVEVFMAMGTQWNTGMNGATGLRYEALPPVLRLLGVPCADQAAVFSGLRVMERTALEVMRDGR